MPSLLDSLVNTFSENNILSRYLLVHSIGEGAFSHVFKAWDQTDKQFVAIKVTVKSEINSIHSSSIYKESWIHKRLCHKNIVKLFDFHEIDDYFIMVLEWLDGGELFDYVKSRVFLSEDEARPIMKQLCEALVYLHDHVGLVHRDLKFENILFSKNKADGSVQTVKIADFGLAKILGQSQSTKTPCGTLFFAAPEILKDESYEKSVDSWSLGCILYTILCGFPPFNGLNDKEVAKNIAKGWFTFVSPWWDDISYEAKHLVTKLLDINPKKRWTSAQLLHHPWIKGEKMIRSESELDMSVLQHESSQKWTIPPVLKTPLDCGEYNSSSSQDPSSLCIWADFQQALLSPNTQSTMQISWDKEIAPYHSETPSSFTPSDSQCTITNVASSFKLKNDISCSTVLAKRNRGGNVPKRHVHFS